MKEIVKVCKVHGELKLIDITKYNCCRICKGEASKAYRIKNKEKIRIRDKKNRSNIIWIEKRKIINQRYEEKNKEKIAIRKKELYLLNLPKNRERKAQLAREYRKRHPERIKKTTKKTVDNMTNNYMITSILHSKGILSRKDIPQEYIDARRELLKLKRKLREIKNGNN